MLFTEWLISSVPDFMCETSRVRLTEGADYILFSFFFSFFSFFTVIISLCIKKKKLGRSIKAIKVIDLLQENISFDN